MNNDTIRRKDFYKSLVEIRDRYEAMGDPILASTINEAIINLRDFPAANADRVAVYAEALATFGVETQLVVALEELSELQKEICKALRGFTHPAELAEELADATIMLEQLRYIFSVGPVAENIMANKVARLRQRIEEAKT